jgi:TolB protein
VVPSEILAFAARNVESGDGIYLVRPDGKGLTLMSPGDSPPSAVQWSPDGSRNAYLRDGALFIVDADGGNLRRIVTGIRSSLTIAWNPAG